MTYRRNARKRVPLHVHYNVLELGYPFLSIQAPCTQLAFTAMDNVRNGLRGARIITVSETGVSAFKYCANCLTLLATHRR